jgi:glutaredoxin
VLHESTVHSKEKNFVKENLEKIERNQENKTAKNKYSSRSLPVLIIVNRMNF